MRWESLMIEGHEFLVRAVEGPTREEPVAHECICLLVEEVVYEEGETKQALDKCHAKIYNPDQAFCDDCEYSNHPTYENQMGTARNIHKRGKDA